MTDFISEQRTDILENRNSAQQEFADFLETLEDKEIEHIILDISLYGDLDLDILHKEGFHKVKILEFIEGQITSIKNIPKNVKSLICENNLLDELPMPSEYLESLNLKSNFLTTADLKLFPNLKRVYLSYNRLTKIENIHSKIRELYCNNNEIRQLNFENADQIQVLYCSNNPHLLIEHFPTSLKTFEMKNTQFLEIYLGNNQPSEKQVKEHSQKVDYVNAIHSYFKMKQEYEKTFRQIKTEEYKKLRGKNTPIRKIKRILSEIQAPCVNCKQLYGTIFSLKSTSEARVYSVICGNRKNPCNLNIQLSTGQFMNIWTSIETAQYFLQEYKEKIIKHKLDVLFNYIGEETAAKEFKTDLEEYYQTKELYEHAIKKYESLYHNSETNEKIQEKLNHLFDHLEKMEKMIHEYKSALEDNGRAILKDAMNIYFKEIMNLTQQIYSLKNGMSEMYYDEKTEIYTLKQWTTTFANMDYSYQDSPEVLKYIRL